MQTLTPAQSKGLMAIDPVNGSHHNSSKWGRAVMRSDVRAALGKMGMITTKPHQGFLANECRNGHACEWLVLTEAGLILRAGLAKPSSPFLREVVSVEADPCGSFLRYHVYLDCAHVLERRGPVPKKPAKAYVCPFCRYRAQEKESNYGHGHPIVGSGGET